MAYERSRGRRPTEMPHHNPGYDVESAGLQDSIERYIEVKSLSGPWGRRGVTLTHVQFEFARRNDVRSRVWLYVVEKAEDDRLYQIFPLHNPVARATQFVFDEGWRPAAEGATDLEALRIEELELVDDLVKPLIDEVIAEGAPVPVVGHELSGGEWTVEAAWPPDRIAVVVDANADRDTWMNENDWTWRSASEWSVEDLLQALGIDHSSEA